MITTLRLTCLTSLAFAFAAAPTLRAATTFQSGKTVTLTATAGGSAPFSYQWYKGGSPVSGATNSTLVFTAATSAVAGSYTVRVTNSGGSMLSDVADLAMETVVVTNPVVEPPVNVAPVITAQPAGKTVNMGSAVSFSVTATGTPAPTYAWKKDGVAISGATAATYSLTSAASANAGSYTVVVTNSQGSVTSMAAVLAVTPNVAPVITAQPAGKTVTAGSAVSFSVTATGTPSPTYVWKKNGVAISGATGATYNLTSVAAANAGTYTVVVTNAQGSVTSSGAVLKVQVMQPVIVTQPTNQSTTAGSSTTFSVVAQEQLVTNE